jgi:hypothetical protein
MHRFLIAAVLFAQAQATPVTKTIFNAHEQNEALNHMRAGG